MDDADGGEAAEDEVGEVELPPGVALPGCRRVPVVVVVPAPRRPVVPRGLPVTAFGGWFRASSMKGRRDG